MVVVKVSWRWIRSERLGSNMRLRPDNKAQRITEGHARNEAWAKLTPAQKLKALNERLGNGVGAKRQRMKLVAGV